MSTIRNSLMSILTAVISEIDNGTEATVTSLDAGVDSLAAVCCWPHEAVRVLPLVGFCCELLPTADMSPTFLDSSNIRRRSVSHAGHNNKSPFPSVTVLSLHFRG